MSTIPASLFVRTVPGVLAVAGSAVDMITLMLTTSSRVPIGTVISFPGPDAVGDHFGAGSDEAAKAAVYFAGFSNAQTLPGALLMARYNQTDAAAYLRGGDAAAALTLTQLQALSGSLSVVVDGVTFTDGSISLAAASSFSAAAATIEASLAGGAPASASVTGSIGGVVTASVGAGFTGTGSGTDLTVASSSGVVHVGAQLTGTGVPAGTYIVSQTSGPTGGDGVYVTNHATTSSGDAIVAKSNILDVTAVASGTVHASDTISGAGLAAGTTVLAQLSGATGGVGTYTVDSEQQANGTSVTALSTILNVTAVGSGTVEVGAVLSGTAITANSVVASEITGTGGVGTYRLSRASTTVSETITTDAVAPVVSFDSVSGAFVITSGITGAGSTAAFATGTLAAPLLLTAATGAVLSQGAAAAAPAAFMNGVVAQTTNWVNFMTLFDPDGGSGNSVKKAFADWKNTQGDRFAYVCWDPDPTPAAVDPASASLGHILASNGDSGTELIWAPDATLAAFECGAAASIAWGAPGGRTNMAFRNQAGLAASVTTAEAAVNLGGNPQVEGSFGNGYNYFGAVGNANANFLWYQRGTVTGRFRWFDSFLNQVWWNSLLQTALLSFMGAMRSIPFNDAGAGLIDQALADPIQTGLAFGAAAPGIISSEQVAEVNAEAGANIAGTLQTQGYYLQVLQQSSAVRANRGPWRITLWYLDRGSVQSIQLNSVAVQ